MKLKYYIMLLLFGVVAFIYFNINPSEANFIPKCPLYSTTGVYCPGCGSQRALHDLLHLNIKEVIGHNLLFLLGLFIIGYHFIIEGINLLKKTKINNLLYHPKTPIFLLIIIVLFWILRNIPFYPFSLLAPDN